MNSFVAGFLSRFFFSYPKEYLSRAIERVEGRGLGSILAPVRTLYIQQAEVDVVLCKQVCCQFSEYDFLSWHQVGLFGDLRGTLWANNPTECSQVLQLEAFPGYKRWPVQTLKPSFKSPLRSP